MPIQYTFKARRERFIRAMVGLVRASLERLGGRPAAGARGLAAAAALGAIALSAIPAAADGLFDGAFEDSSVSFVWENDIFGGTDSNYTNGVQLGWVSAPEQRLPFSRLAGRALPDRYFDGYSSWRTGLAVGHSMFTPADIAAFEPDPADRPYAGWLYGSVSVYGEKVGFSSDISDRILDIAQIDIGLVGDGALGEEVQSGFHQLIDGQDPNGWRHQIKDEPGITLRLGRQRRKSLTQIGPIDIEGELYGNVAVGNVETSAAVGTGLRVGEHLFGDFGPPRIRPALGGASFVGGGTPYSWYLFAGIEGRAVPHSIFLDGNSFRDSRSVDRDPFVFDAQTGIAVRLGDVRLSFTYVHRTEEFSNQTGASRFGAGAISWRF